jgi:uncharacterized protein (DUF1499 family)
LKIIATCFFVSFSFLASAGVTLPACPAKPNCVSSLESGEKNIPPLSYTDKAPAQILSTIAELLKQDGAEISSQSEQSLEAIYTSNLFKFKDDVLFVIDDSEKLIHFRSASRSGYYDFSVNSKRLQKLRDLLAQALATPKTP